ncbi:hypothetical protein [Fictibacillus sp. 26RED30]|uniref:hypothetical protein n=1 Tax=Fictibacillus sp. 26RED30 TaxID=2745877 RepID=UPI0018CDF19D|nr:hypothetical protein [Fictibacillus sp. 26RED30]MBH0159866.1 hypothetical protein [Fictibacillus sp. 26RED30]
MPLIPVSAEFPSVQVMFILPESDFPEDNTETFKGYQIGSYAIYKNNYNEAYLVKVKDTEKYSVVIAEGPSMNLGKLKMTRSFKKSVYELVQQLESMTAWEFVSNVLLKDPMSVELKLTKGL